MSIKMMKPVLPWLVGGLLLGLIQTLAVGIKKPLGVSTQFPIAVSKVIHQTNPDYAENHPLISTEKYQTFGYGFWLDIGLIVGALAAAVISRQWKSQTTTVWWEANYGHSPMKRFVFAFIGGFFILLGARMAHGCTSGQFASGWAQLSVSAIPFTISMFVLGMITARIIYPKTPELK